VLIYIAIATGLAAVYMFIVTLRPLVDQAVVTADDWQRLEDESLDIILHRDRIIEELRDLEFEAAMDKVEQADLDVLRRRYESEALRLMGEIETQIGAYGTRIDADVQDVIDRARTRRAQRASKQAIADVTAAGQVETSDGALGDPPQNDVPEEPSVSAAADEDSVEAPADDERVAPVAPTASAPKEERRQETAVQVPFDWIRDLPCEQCGTVVTVGSAFCDGCGAVVVRACESCGHGNRLSAQFCRACGESLAEGGTA